MTLQIDVRMDGVSQYSRVFSKTAGITNRQQKNNNILFGPHLEEMCL